MSDAPPGHAQNIRPKRERGPRRNVKTSQRVDKIRNRTRRIRTINVAEGTTFPGHVGRQAGPRGPYSLCEILLWSPDLGRDPAPRMPRPPVLNRLPLMGAIYCPLQQLGGAARTGQANRGDASMLRNFRAVVIAPSPQPVSGRCRSRFPSPSSVPSGLCADRAAGSCECPPAGRQIHEISQAVPWVGHHAALKLSAAQAL